MATKRRARAAQPEAANAQPGKPAKRAAPAQPPAMVVDPEPPAVRPLKVYAFDPSRGRYLGNVMTLAVPYERLQPGPVGRKIAIVDVDGGNDSIYGPVDLDHPDILIRNGLDPSESSPHFHQQMVYAVTMETIERFEAALGRPIHWRRDRADEDIWVLKIFPHAMPQANAFYSPRAQGILYGYFRASDTRPGRNLPGQTVFTCLSHDIIVHETTHAIVDGIRAHFTEGTNVDVAAFHEAFADLAALFRHFAHKEVLLDTIKRTGGLFFSDELEAQAPASAKDGSSPGARIQAQLKDRNPLIDLARQFGDAIGRNQGLRCALGTPPDPQDLAIRSEPHARGSILVAAVFDAYFSVYVRLTEPYLAIFRAGGGRVEGDLPQPLAEVLADTASRLAETFFRVCAQSLDYCPPIDVTFGDFLRAVITAHHELDPIDRDRIRNAFMEAFRLRGIVSEGAAFFSEDALLWPRAPDELAPLPELRFGQLGRYLTKEEKDHNGKLLREYAKDPTNRAALGFDPDLALDVDVPSFHPVHHTGANGKLQVSMVVEMVQTRRVPIDPNLSELGTFPLRSAATLIIGAARSTTQPPRVRYLIRKSTRGPDISREDRQRQFHQRSGFLEGEPNDDSRCRIDFALIHGGL